MPPRDAADGMRAKKPYRKFGGTVLVTRELIRLVIWEKEG